MQPQYSYINILYKEVSADNRLSAAKNAADKRLSGDNQLYIFSSKPGVKVFQFIFVSYYCFLFYTLNKRFYF